MKPICFFLFFLSLTGNAFPQDSIKYESDKHVLLMWRQELKVMRWEENKFDLLVEGHDCNEIVAKAKHGKIEINDWDCKLIYRIEDTITQRDTIYIGVKKGKKIKWIKEMILPVIPIRDPVPMVYGYLNNTPIAKSHFSYRGGITVPLTHSWHFVNMPYKQKVTSYDIKIARKDSIIYEKQKITEWEFTEEFRNFVKTTTISGDEVTIYNIETIIHDTEPRSLTEPFRFTIK